jgi:septum site-determining protein MinD
MGKVLTIASGKGGVGKTTITANLGIALSQKGKRVLLVDADVAMANLSLLLGMHSSPITLHDVLLGESSIQDAIYDGPAGVFFIPSGLSLESYRRVDPERLESIISSIKEDFDFILIDSPPGIEKSVLSALKAADFILLITTPTSPSVADILKTKIVAQRIGVQPLGVIINFVRGEKGEIKDEDIMKMLELPIYGIIPFDDEVRKSFMQEKILPVVLRKPKSPASIAVNQIADKLIGRKVEFKPTKTRENPIKRFLNKFSSIFKRKKGEKKGVKEKKVEEFSTSKEIPEIDENFIEIEG